MKHANKSEVKDCALITTSELLVMIAKDAGKLHDSIMEYVDSDGYSCNEYIKMEVNFLVMRQALYAWESAKHAMNEGSEE